MKQLSLLLFLSFFIMQATAQQPGETYNLNQEDLVKKRSLEKLLKPDTLKTLKLPLIKNRSEVMIEQRNYDHGIIIPLTRKKVGNNGMGADIYVSNHYNMPSISPDSTYVSRMPVAGLGMQKVGKGN